MGRAYRSFCQTIFVIKAMSALIIALSFLTMLSYMVFLKYENRIKPLPPIEAPLTGESCYYTSTTRARLEPPEGSFFFGMSLQWDRDTPQQVQERMGKFSPPLYNSFVQMSSSDFKKDIIMWNAETVRDTGGLLEITLMIEEGVQIDTIPISTFQEFASLMRIVNYDLGVGVLLRFMHEMNGPWMGYGLKPVQFKKAWIDLTTEIRAQTNMTAMVWSPNIAGGYPFRNAGYDYNIPTMETDPDNFEELDTVKDGILDNFDDPYTPYYPGEEWVDWIGVSLYSHLTKNGQHIPEPDGVLTTTDGPITLNNRYYPYYINWVEGTGKPFMFSETAAAIVSNIAGQPQIVKDPPTDESELAVKQQWWRQILQDTIYAEPDSLLSRTKAAVWFEEVKDETSYDNENAKILRDYRVTFKPFIQDALVADLKKAGSRITYPGKFKFACNGDFTFTK